MVTVHGISPRQRAVKRVCVCVCIYTVSQKKQDTTLLFGTSPNVNLFNYFYSSMLCIRGTRHGPVPVCVCLSVSVTSRSSTKTAKRRITQTTPHDTPKTLVFWCHRAPRNSPGSPPTRVPNAGGVGHNRRLLT